MANNNPDLLYQKSREQLLNYEDARLNSLLQSVADFYITRNDQSIWGNFLRGLARELSRLDFDYSYDIVNKDPNFLTPPDIRRRWAAPLYVSSNWPSLNQFDFPYKLMLVQLIAAYKMGTTVKAIQDVIFAYTGINIQVQELYKQIGNGIFDQSDRNSISVSVQVGGAGSNPLNTVTSLAQLQIIVQSLYNAIALAKPAHVGLEFTTVFGESEDLDCNLTPEFLTQQQYAVMSPTVQSFYTHTGYAPINPAVFWKASTPFEINNVLRDSAGNFQLLINTGALPNESGLIVPVWSIVSGNTTLDGNLTWDNISPAVVSTAVVANLVTVTLSFPVSLRVGTKVTLINVSGANGMALNNVPLVLLSVDPTGTIFTAAFTHANYATEVEAFGTATFALPAAINTLQYNLLNGTWKSLYQKTYTNTNCAALTPLQPWYHPGINDTLRIFVLQKEAQPQGPMLIQAPVFDPKNPKTTVAAYGRLLSPSLTPAQWGALPLIYVNIQNGMSDGVNATYSYVPTTQFLHEGEIVAVTGFVSLDLNVTAQIKNVFNLVSTIHATSITSNVLSVAAPNLFHPSMLVTFANTAEPFLNGQTVIVSTASPTGFTAAFTHANYTNLNDTGTAEVSTFQIANTNTVALEVPSPTANAGLVEPTLQSAYYLNNGVYVLGLPPIATSGAGIGSSWVPLGNVFQGQIIVDSIGNTQVAVKAGTSLGTTPVWNQTLQGSTQDGSVVWRNVGRNFFSAPNTWVGILNFNNDPATFTGEVGNWDFLHQYGLVAPRLNQVWEISGGDQDFIFGLF